MGLFSKKEEVPVISQTPTLPELPTEEKKPEEKSLPELPSFPTNSKNETLNQEMVKSAVTDMPSPGENEVHVEIPKDFQVDTLANVTEKRRFDASRYRTPHLQGLTLVRCDARAYNPVG